MNFLQSRADFPLDILIDQEQIKVFVHVSPKEKQEKSLAKIRSGKFKVSVFGVGLQNARGQT